MLTLERGVAKKDFFAGGLNPNQSDDNPLLSLNFLDSRLKLVLYPPPSKIFCFIHLTLLVYFFWFLVNTFLASYKTLSFFRAMSFLKLVSDSDGTAVRDATHDLLVNPKANSFI